MVSRPHALSQTTLCGSQPALECDGSGPSSWVGTFAQGLPFQDLQGGGETEIAPWDI